MKGVPPRPGQDLHGWAEQLHGWLEQQLDENLLVPVGTIIAFSSDQLPDGWLLCDGSEYRIDDFPSLSFAVSDLWNEGVPPAAGFFKVPDLRGRVLAGSEAADVGTITDAVASGTDIETASLMYLIKV